MSDQSNREEMELAAKAYGVTLHWKEGSCKGGPYESAFIERGGELVPWRPLEDDGDSRRLQVKLKMDINNDMKLGIEIVYAAAQGWRWSQAAEEKLGSAPYAATRLAVFRAAVALGKCLP